jgi:prepilin-type N-terminal cleavage/methylation domain-containing protein
MQDAADLRSPLSRLRHPRGFTLLEVMIVVAIIGVVATVAVWSIERQRERVGMERGIAQMRGAIELSRALATVAGPRSGSGRLVADASCNWVAANQMEVQVDGPNGTINYPSSVAIGADPEQLVVSCDTWRVRDAIEGTGAGLAGVPLFSSPAGVINFAFSPSGRLVTDAGLTTAVFIQLQGSTNEVPPGVRVLASGIMCQSSDPTNAVPCDEASTW